MASNRYPQPRAPRGHYPTKPAVPPAPPAPKPKSLTTGDPALWTLLQMVRDPATGATKTTRALPVPGGVIINTCTRGATFAAEALAFVPGATVLRASAGVPAQIVAQA